VFGQHDKPEIPEGRMVETGGGEERHEETMVGKPGEQSEEGERGK